MLKQFHQKTDYRVSVPLALLRQAEATKRTFNIVLGSIAGISLLVGGIGIMNIMLASVTERTREIGIRRAIGAKRRQIIGQFLIETTVLVTMGGLVGSSLGLLIPWLITRIAGMPTVVTGYSLMLSVGISVPWASFSAYTRPRAPPTWTRSTRCGTSDQRPLSTENSVSLAPQGLVRAPVQAPPSGRLT